MRGLLLFPQKVWTWLSRLRLVVRQTDALQARLEKLEADSRSRLEVHEGRHLELEGLARSTSENAAAEGQRLEKLMAELREKLDVRMATEISAREASVKNLVSDLENLDANIALGAAARLIPKRDSAVFVGRPGFSDNAKYAYLAYLKARLKDSSLPPALYLCPSAATATELRAAGLPGVIDPRALGSTDVDFLLRARTMVTAETLPPRRRQALDAYVLLSGAEHVALWHGVPLKKIGLQNIDGQRSWTAEVAGSLEFCTKIDALAMTARAQSEAWGRCFSFREAWALGYPRNDALFREPGPWDLLGVDLEALAFARLAPGRTFCLAPTFREATGLGAWFDRFDWPALDRFLAAKDSRLILALHPYDSVWREKLNGFGLRRILVARAGSDIYPVLRECAALLTDYSSIFVDFLLVDRPILFVRVDDEVYRLQNRALTTDFIREAPGEIVTDQPALELALADVLDGHDGQKAQRAAARGTLFDQPDGRAGERFVEALLASWKNPRGGTP